MAMIGVAVLGSTGSIGESTLDVLRQHPDRFRAVALTAHRNAARLFAQCAEFRPDVALIADTTLHAALAARLREAGLATTLLAGTDQLSAIATLPSADYVMAAIVGAAGLRSTLAAAIT
jgi:1-deoxy-D-xylulose-5-phosphate reductoisomerase